MQKKSMVKMNVKLIMTYVMDVEHFNLECNFNERGYKKHMYILYMKIHILG